MTSRRGIAVAVAFRARAHSTEEADFLAARVARRGPGGGAGLVSVHSTGVGLANIQDRLAQAGITCGEVTVYPGFVQYCDVTDPEGTVISLVEHLGGA